MHFIIFGAGVIGIRAWEFLQNDRVKCFADNYKAGQVMKTMMGNVPAKKAIISFSQMLEIYKKGNSIIVVASGNYSQDLVAQLEEEGIVRYFVFKESDGWKIWAELPFYRLYRRYESVTYTRRLMDHKISTYKRIAILGSNEFLPYLISAIAIQAGFDSIIGVVDTPEAHAANRMGLPLLSWNETKENADCVVVNSHRKDTYYCEELEDVLQPFHIVRLFEVEQEMSMYFHPELTKYKNIHKGKRCFLLGNGPSLTIEDLETLYKNNEICFGCNKVYRIYPKTNWRADYLVVTDYRVIEDMRDDDMRAVPGTKFIADLQHRSNESLLDGFEVIHFYDEDYIPRNYPRFSDDIVKGVYLGGSVVYDMSIQIAAYMGFDEMYIMGVDLSYTGNYVENKENYFIKDYVRMEEKGRYTDVDFDRYLPRMHRAFEKAEKYSRQHGFRIYNATRGGNLEAFERVNFDDLF